jgi:hypothetical protein
MCEQKRSLLEAYQYVTEKYSAGVTELQRTMGTLSKTEYDALYRMTEALRHDAMRTQGDLQDHVRAHRC